jgi:hypothetical protein
VCVCVCVRERERERERERDSVWKGQAVAVLRAAHSIGLEFTLQFKHRDFRIITGLVSNVSVLTDVTFSRFHTRDLLLSQ